MLTIFQFRNKQGIKTFSIQYCGENVESFGNKAFFLASTFDPIEGKASFESLGRKYYFTAQFIGNGDLT